MALTDASLDAARAAAGVTGASLAVWDGAALTTAVAGMRNSVTGDPITEDTVMHIGSITKIFNAVLVMQLVDDGLIALEDPVVKHLPDFELRDRAARDRITCGMLLNHTSGIDGIFIPDHGPDRERIEDAMPRIAGLEQLHAPGGGPSYNNAAVVVAGYLAQRVRGDSWYTLVKERIYEPLGMRHALADLTDLPRFRASVGDLTDPATGAMIQTTRPFLPLSFAPAGATLIMTASDLVTFGRAMMRGGVGPNGGRILSRDSAERMMRPTVRMILPTDQQWGLGWMLMPDGLVHHGGGGPGVSSLLYAHPASGRVLALLTNCGTARSSRRWSTRCSKRGPGSRVEHPSRRWSPSSIRRPTSGSTRT
ncbi:MAG: serine hydrolase domain-containing protein [Gemmatimonadales bacterium]